MCENLLEEISEKDELLKPFDWQRILGQFRFACSGLLLLEDSRFWGLDAFESAL